MSLAPCVGVLLIISAAVNFPVYSWLIHGASSTTSPHFSKSLGMAHDLTQRAILRGLAIYRRVDHRGKGSLAGLQKIYVRQHSRKAQVLKALEADLKRKKRKSA